MKRNRRRKVFEGKSECWRSGGRRRRRKDICERKTRNSLIGNNSGSSLMARQNASERQMPDFFQISSRLGAFCAHWLWLSSHYCRLNELAYRLPRHLASSASFGNGCSHASSCSWMSAKLDGAFQRTIQMTGGGNKVCSLSQTGRCNRTVPTGFSTPVHDDLCCGAQYTNWWYIERI